MGWYSPASRNIALQYLNRTNYSVILLSICSSDIKSTAYLKVPHFELYGGPKHCVMGIDC